MLETKTKATKLMPEQSKTKIKYKRYQKQQDTGLYYTKNDKQLWVWSRENLKPELRSKLVLL